MNRLNLYDRFLSDYGVEILEDIAESLWHNENYGTVEINEIHEINKTNHTISGLFKHEDKEVYFIMDMGDQDGTYVRYYGEEYQEVKHAHTVWRYEIIAARKHGEETIKILREAVEESEVLQDLIKDFAYDMYVTGNGAASREYYRRKLDRHPWGKNLEFISETVYT